MEGGGSSWLSDGRKPAALQRLPCHLPLPPFHSLPLSLNLSLSSLVEDRRALKASAALRSLSVAITGIFADFPPFPALSHFLPSSPSFLHRFGPGMRAYHQLASMRSGSELTNLGTSYQLCFEICLESSLHLDSSMHKKIKQILVQY